MSAPKFIINNIERISITLVVYVVGLIENLLNIKIYRIRADRIGHLALNHDLFFRRVNAGILDNQKFILVGPMEDNSHWVANKTLYRLIKNEAIKNSKIIFICSSIIYKLLSASSAKIKESGINVELEIHSNEVEFSLYDRVLYLSKHDKQRGWNKIKFLNIPDKSKIVCVFARDSAYLYMKDGLRDWSYHDYRNADIDTYIPAIKYLIDLGYFVIRIGSTASSQVNYKNKYFLDYPFSDLRSDFMDIFLIDISTFIVGTTSGITDVATVFNIPFLGVNYAPFTESPLGKNDLFIQKKLINKSNAMVKYIDALELGVDDAYYGDIFYERTKLEYVDNSKDDILDATVEMESVINNSYILIKKDKILIDKYFSEFWKSNKRALVKTQPCISWLKKNISLYVNKA